MLQQGLNYTGNAPAEKKETIAIIDIGGKLKLARWRLHGDGYRVIYLHQVPDRQAFIQEQPDLALLNVMDPVEGMETFASLLEMFPTLRVMLVLGNRMEHLFHTAINLGAAGFVTRPVDFPALSSAVKEQLMIQPVAANEERLYKKISRRFRLGPSPEQFFWKSILHAVKSGVLLVNRDGEIEYTNAALAKWLQNDLNDSRKNCWQVLAELPYTLSRDLAGVLEQALQQQEIVYEKEYGNYKISSYLLYDDEKKIAGSFVVIDEITRQNRVETDMARTEKLAMVGQLAAGAAHEIRNPLTSVRGFIQLLRKELLNTPKAEYIDIIITEIDRVNSIVSDFLKLAKPATPRWAACHVEELFNEIRVLIDSEAFLKNVEVIEEIGPLPEIMIDKEQVKQVLINIMQNSFDAMPQGGELTIRVVAEPEVGAVKISIQDSGCGMDREIVDRIFKPFYTTKETGTGLGLSVSLQIIENHGGRIEVDSAPGRGTTTNIYLPCQD